MKELRGGEASATRWNRRIMDLITDIKNLGHQEIFFGILCFLGILAPGVLIIFHFRPDLFQSLDAFKMIVLALALTVPLGLFNSVLVHTIWDSGKTGPFENAALACAFTFLFTYPLILLAYFCGFRFRAFLWTLIALELLAYIAATIRGYLTSKHGGKQ